MANSIRLHKQYGLNPTLCTCFYCGEETGEIALLGANFKGEAPRHMCTSLEPCPSCKEKYKDFVLLIEVEPINRNKPQPTGRWGAIKKEYVAVPNKGICYIDTSTYNQLLQERGTNG